MHIIIFIKKKLKKKKINVQWNCETQKKKRKRKKGKKKIVGKPHLLRQVEVAQKIKIVIIKRKCGQFCPNIFVQLSLSFSLQFGETVFWRGRRKNWWVPPKSLLFSTLNQTTKNIIFSSLFSPSFSILSRITPNKHSLREWSAEENFKLVKAV